MQLIANHLNTLGELAANLAFILFCFTVSLIYWLKDTNTGFKRIAVSAHSVVLLILFGSTFVVGYFGYSDKSLLMPYYLLLAIPVASIMASLVLFKGSKWVHLLHLWNLLVLPWIWFVGSMAVSGDWI